VGGRVLVVAAGVLDVVYFSPNPRIAQVDCSLRFIEMCRSLFRPEFFYWRLVLTLRKLFEVAIALMFSTKPLFQAW
jgi:hypothetical protein